MKASPLAAALAIWLLTGCAANHYAHTSAGRFYGTPLIEWKNDEMKKAYEAGLAQQEKQFAGRV